MKEYLKTNLYNCTAVSVLHFQICHRLAPPWPPRCRRHLEFVRHFEFVTLAAAVVCTGLCASHILQVFAGSA